MRPTERRPGEYVVDVVRRADHFTVLSAEWHKLCQASPRATSFQSHAWLDAWWQAYGKAGRLRVLLVRDGTGQLVAAAPLHVERRGGARTLTTLGGAISDYTDVLVAEDRLAPEQVPCVVSAMVDGLVAISGWDVLDLPEVRAGSMAEQLFAAWNGRRWSVDSSTCMELHAATFDELLSRLSSKRASEVRRRLRRADELGLEVSEVPAAEVAEGVADLLALHAEQWEGRGVNPEHLRERFAAHLHRALTTMIADGDAVLTRVRLDGAVVAVTLSLIGHRLVCGYLTGVAPHLYRRIDVTAFILRNEWRCMSRAGISGFSMLRGREAYKNSWHPDVAVNRRLVLTRPGAPLALLGAYGAVTVARGRALGRRHAPRLRELGRRLVRRP